MFLDCQLFVIYCTFYEEYRAMLVNNSGPKPLNVKEKIKCHRSFQKHLNPFDRKDILTPSTKHPVQHMHTQKGVR